MVRINNPFQLNTPALTSANRPGVAPVVQESVKPVAPVAQEATSQRTENAFGGYADAAANVGRAGIQFGGKPQGLTNPAVLSGLTALAKANPQDQAAIIGAMQFDLNS